MKQFERRVYSQNGEDGIIEEIFCRIGVTNRFFVEFGVQDGVECNTRLLRETGWSGVCFDSACQNKYVNRFFLTAENINDVFASFGVPAEFDLLSIDVDGNDFWLWKALTSCFPRCVVIEYNAQLPPKKRLTIPYQARFKWKRRPHDDFFGASLGALIELGRDKGYSYICVNEWLNNRYVNAFFVKSEYSCKFAEAIPPQTAFLRYRHDELKSLQLIDPFV